MTIPGIVTLSQHYSSRGDQTRNMTTYQDIRRQVKTLTPDEQLHLLEEITVNG